MNTIKSKFQQIKEDMIKGGLSDNLTLKDIADKHNIDISILRKQLTIGLGVEKEHTSNENVAKEIALDHLFEDPEYYTKLQKMEKGECNTSTKIEIPIKRDHPIYNKLLKIWEIDETWEIFIEKYENPFKLELEAKKDSKKIELYLCPENTNNSLNIKLCLKIINNDKIEIENENIISIEEFLSLIILKQNDILKFLSSGNNIIKK